MKLLLSSILLPLLAIASPAYAAPKPHPPFGVMSARSGSPIHLLPMTARDERFWLGGKTTSYCPSNVGTSCPPGKETVFAAGGTAMVRMNTQPNSQYSLPGRCLFALFLSVSCTILTSYTGRRSPRRPTGLHRSPRRSAIHPGPLSLHPTGLLARSLQVRAGLSLRPLHLHGRGCLGLHGLSEERSLAGLCRH